MRRFTRYREASASLSGMRRVKRDFQTRHLRRQPAGMKVRPGLPPFGNFTPHAVSASR